MLNVKSFLSKKKKCFRTNLAIPDFSQFNSVVRKQLWNCTIKSDAFLDNTHIEGHMKKNPYLLTTMTAHQRLPHSQTGLSAWPLGTSTPVSEWLKGPLFGGVPGPELWPLAPHCSIRVIMAGDREQSRGQVRANYSLPAPAWAQVRVTHTNMCLYWESKIYIYSSNCNKKVVFFWQHWCTLDFNIL